MPQREIQSGQTSTVTPVLHKSSNEQVIGYLIYYGVTSCRVFEIITHDKLNEKYVATYSVKYTEDALDEYQDSIIETTKYLLEDKAKSSTGSHAFIKAYADPAFLDIFSDERVKDTFIDRLYDECNIVFNIVSRDQEKKNIQTLIGAIQEDTIIVHIGSNFLNITHIQLSQKEAHQTSKITTYEIKITLDEVKNVIADMRYSPTGVWNNNQWLEIKKAVKELLNSKQTFDFEVPRAIILKDELSFMERHGYSLTNIDGTHKGLKIAQYKKDNHRILFEKDFEKTLQCTGTVDEKELRRLNGFKTGHLVLESLFEILNVKTVIPLDKISIHGSVEAYFFNVTLSGSTNDGREQFMYEAKELLESMGATVLSPKFVDGTLVPHDNETDRYHAASIRECDLLFVCNKDGYIGNQTSREIYAAFVNMKPIAYWKEPKAGEEKLSYIPHERWEILIDNIQQL